MRAGKFIERRKSRENKKKSFGNFSSFFVFAPRTKQTIKKIAFSCFTHTPVRGCDGGKVLTTYFAWIAAPEVHRLWLWLLLCKWRLELGWRSWWWWWSRRTCRGRCDRRTSGHWIWLLGSSSSLYCCAALRTSSRRFRLWSWRLCCPECHPKRRLWRHTAGFCSIASDSAARSRESRAIRWWRARRGIPGADRADFGTFRSSSRCRWTREF